MNYKNTPFNYTGSKFKLLDQILPKFDYTKNNFVDIFAGGGSVYTNILDKYDKIIVNDVIKDLIGIHESLLLSDDIIEETMSLCPDKGDKDSFLNLREDYNNDNTSSKLWALMLSSTNNMIRFNLKFKYNQSYGNRGWNSNTTLKVEEFKNHIREYKDKIKYISKPFNELKLPISKDIMFYFDPPYGRIKNEDDTMGNKQISEAGYNAFWKKEDDINLYNYIKEVDKMGSSFMVSGVLEHNNLTCWMLDKLINDGYEFEVLEHNYNKVSKKGEKNTKEVIIKNY